MKAGSARIFACLLAVGFSAQASATTYDVTLLGSLGGMTSYAWGINNSGQVVGSSNPVGQAVIWNGTTPTALGSLGGTWSFATGINNSGQVVGYSGTAGNASNQAVIWNGTIPAVLTSLNGTNSQALGINDSGQVVGSSTTRGNATQQAVIWNGNTPTALGSLGGTNSEAYGINNSGQVVGFSNTAGNVQHGAIWNGTTAIDINTLFSSDPSGLVISNLTGINSSGQIVGYGYDSLGHTDAVLLTPLPPPVGVPAPVIGAGLPGLIFVGGGLLGLWRRKRKADA